MKQMPIILMQMQKTQKRWESDEYMSTYNVLFYGGLVLAIIFLIITVILFFALKIPRVFGDLTGRTERKSIEAIRKSGYETKSKQEAIRAETSRITVREAVNDLETNNLKKRNIDKKAAQATKMKSRASEMTASFDDATEVLGSEEESSGLGDATEILGTEADDETTDVLRQYTDDEDTTDILTSDVGENDATDVLTSNDGEDDVTDILTSEEKDDVTDILTQDEAAGTSEQIGSNIIGRYSAEETAVLRSIHEPAAGMNTNAEKTITVIYNVTVVHTEESLQSEVD